MVSCHCRLMRLSGAPCFVILAAVYACRALMRTRRRPSHPASASWRAPMTPGYVRSAP